MMTREQIENAIKCCNPYDENCGDCPFNKYPQGRCFEVLAKTAFSTLLEDRERLQKQVKEYQGKIEQGTLIELPVKLTEKCYVIFGRNEKYIKEVCVIMYEIGTVDKWARVVWYEGERKLWEDFHTKELYATREEAEKRLKELQNG